MTEGEKGGRRRVYGGREGDDASESQNGGDVGGANVRRVVSREDGYPRGRLPGEHSFVTFLMERKNLKLRDHKTVGSLKLLVLTSWSLQRGPRRRTRRGPSSRKNENERTEKRREDTEGEDRGKEPIDS